MWDKKPECQTSSPCQVWSHFFFFFFCDWCLTRVSVSAVQATWNARYLKWTEHKNYAERHILRIYAWDFRGVLLNKYQFIFSMKNHSVPTVNLLEPCAHFPSDCFLKSWVIQSKQSIINSIQEIGLWRLLFRLSSASFFDAPDICTSFSLPQVFSLPYHAVVHLIHPASLFATSV